MLGLLTWKRISGIARSNVAAACAVKESNQMRYAKGLLLFLFVVLANHSALSQSPQTSVDGDGGGSILMGSLAEIRNGRRVVLLVRRSAVIDSRGQARAIINEAYKADPDARFRYPRLFNSLARKLNNYMKKYGKYHRRQKYSGLRFHHLV